MTEKALLTFSPLICLLVPSLNILYTRIEILVVKVHGPFEETLVYDISQDVISSFVKENQSCDSLRNVPMTGCILLAACYMNSQQSARRGNFRVD